MLGKYVTKNLRVTAAKFTKGSTFPVAIPELHLNDTDSHTRCVMCWELLRDHGVIDGLTKMLFVCPGGMVVRIEGDALSIISSDRVFSLSEYLFEMIFKKDTAPL